MHEWLNKQMHALQINICYLLYQFVTECSIPISTYLPFYLADTSIHAPAITFVCKLVLLGASSKLWRWYFPQAEIYQAEYSKDCVEKHKEKLDELSIKVCLTNLPSPSMSDPISYPLSIDAA